MRFRRAILSRTANAINGYRGRSSQRLVVGSATKEPQSVHVLRHTFRSRLGMKGAPARAIQKGSSKVRRRANTTRERRLERATGIEPV